MVVELLAARFALDLSDELLEESLLRLQVCVVSLLLHEGAEGGQVSLLAHCFVELLQTNLAADCLRKEALHLSQLFEELRPQLEAFGGLLTYELVQHPVDVAGLCLAIKCGLHYLSKVDQLSLVCFLNLEFTEQLPSRLNVSLNMGAQFLNFRKNLVAERAYLLVAIGQLLVELDSQLLYLIFVCFALLSDALDLSLIVLPLLARLIFLLLGFGAKVFLDSCQLTHYLVPECGHKLLHLADVGFRDQRV